MSEPALDADAIIIGGGPAGSALGTYLARDGHKVMILEKDIHPRDHVGESLVPSTNLVFQELGVFDKIKEAGFVPKPGSAWNSPRSALWKFIEVWLFSVDIPGNEQPFTFHVERDTLDALLLRHAYDAGAKVVQGVNVTEVLFENERAVGAHRRAAGEPVRSRDPAAVQGPPRRHERDLRTGDGGPEQPAAPWSFDDILRKSAEYNADEEEVGFRFLPCPTCGERVDMDADRAILVCTKCGTEFPMISSPDRR